MTVNYQDIVNHIFELDTQIVLRFARKYIKDPEGAAVSDLHVSVSGGSVVFRNFELNLEGTLLPVHCFLFLSYNPIKMCYFHLDCGSLSKFGV